MQTLNDLITERNMISMNVVRRAGPQMGFSGYYQFILILEDKDENCVTIGARKLAELDVLLKQKIKVVLFESGHKALVLIGE